MLVQPALFQYLLCRPVLLISMLLAAEMVCKLTRVMGLAYGTESGALTADEIAHGEAVRGGEIF
jgi:hypothetical protein